MYSENGPKSRAGARSRHWLCFVRAAGGEVDAAPVGEKVNKDICACSARRPGCSGPPRFLCRRALRRPVRRGIMTPYIYREKDCFNHMID